MANKDSAGFSSGTKKRVKAPDSTTIYSHHFKDRIPGDVAIAIERVLRESGIEFEEIVTRKYSQHGEIHETPFVRHHVSEELTIPFGTYRVAKLGDIGMTLDGLTTPVIRVTGTLVDKDAVGRWNEFLKAVETSSNRNSIFLGKALRIEDMEDLLVPRPLHLGKDIPVLFNKDIEDELSTCVFWPINNRDAAKKAGIRTKRGTILEGHYGSGKSILMYKAAQAAHKAGWGVVSVKPGMLGAALLMTPLLEPLCLIIEDVDAGAHGDRDRLNNVLNCISSVATKTSGDYMLLMSTNFLNRIDPAMLRPERIDAIVKVDLPNADTIKRLIKTFSNGHLHPAINFDDVCRVMEGCTPAIISEVVQRSMIDGQQKGHGLVTTDAIMFHTARMDRQKAFATPEYRRDSNASQLAQTLYQVVQNGDDTE